MLRLIGLLAGTGLVYYFARKSVRGPGAGQGETASSVSGRPGRPVPDASSRAMTGQPADSYVTSSPIQTGDAATDTAIRLAQETYSTEKIQTSQD